MSDFIIFATRNPTMRALSFSYYWWDSGGIRRISSGLFDVYDMAMVTLSGVYSTILNPILTQPIILEVTCILNSLTANDIINTRVIKSLQLGGRYWVDSMAHDLTTGNTKMKLIKLK